MSLTDYDRRAFFKAGQLIVLDGAAAVCGHTGENDELAAYVAAFTEAQWLIGELVAIAERLADDRSTT